MSEYTFFRTCVDWPKADVHAPGGLVDMVDSATNITRRTFVKHIGNDALHEIEATLGYTRLGLAMRDDWHVSYHRSKLHGQRCYYFRWSGIEFVFTRNDIEETK